MGNRNTTPILTVDQPLSPTGVDLAEGQGLAGETTTVARDTSSNSHDSESFEVGIKDFRGGSLLIKVYPDWDVARLKKEIASKTEANPQDFQIVFVGNVLVDSQIIKDIGVQCQTVLHCIKSRAYRPPNLNNKDIEVKPKNDSDTPFKGRTPGVLTSQMGSFPVQDKGHHRFYVYCKDPCGKVTPGKLRVRCADCKDVSFILFKGPGSWHDVLTPRKLQGQCNKETCNGRYAEFFFKCGMHPSQENETCVALHMIRANTIQVECAACLSIRDIVVVFNCPEGHCLCVKCFKQYCEEQLKNRQFINDQKIGYTLRCPAGCQGSEITEVHHFRLLGKDLYRRYHRYGSEEHTLQSGGVLCQNPKCGQGLIPDSTLADRKIRCPCGFEYCRICKKAYHDGSCSKNNSQVLSAQIMEDQHYQVNPDDLQRARWRVANQRLVKSRTKPCPRCKVPAENNGRCMQMICGMAECKFEWCWICEMEWNRGCQSTHWFGYFADIHARSGTHMPAAETASEVDNSLSETNGKDVEHKLLFEKAMQSGYVLCHIVTLLLIGVAGAGKSSFLNLVLDQPPPSVRESTPLANCAIRALSISRAAMSQGGTIWNVVSPDILLSWLADGIKGKLTFRFSQLLPLSPPKPISLDDSAAVSVDFPSIESQASMLSPNSEPADLQEYATIDDQPESFSLSSSLVSHDKLIENEIIQKLMKLLNSQVTCKKVFDDHWVYLVDTGGQPQFHEMLSTFIKHVSGAALFVKLNENFDDKPMIVYYAEGGHLYGMPYSSSLSHIQIIQNNLQVMQSQHNFEGEQECPKLFFVATHRDLENTCKESREQKNGRLIEMLYSFEDLKKNLSLYQSVRPEKVMYPVNAKNPQDEDRKVVEKFRSAVMNQCKVIKKEIPLSWFILELMLQQLSQSKKRVVLSLEECQEVANDLEIDATHLQAVLHYLDRLNIFKYLHDVLPNVIFVTAQVLLDKVTELVEFSHYLRGEVEKIPAHLTLAASMRDDSMSIYFRDNGIVTKKFLEHFPKHYVDGLFTSQDLLRVLMNDLVFAHQTSDKYFMPCVLPELSTDEISKQLPDQSQCNVPALLIYSSGGLFPSSNFSGLIAFLQNKSSWKVAEKRGIPSCLYKNCVKIKHIGKPVNITLIYSYEYVEVHAQMPSGLCIEACPEIANGILNGLSEVKKVQHCEHLQYKLAFFCSCPDSADLPHSATIDSSSQYCVCSKNDEFNDCLTPQNLLWLGDCKQTPTIEQSVPLSLKSLYILRWTDVNGERKQLRIMSSVMNSWRKIGILFGIPSSKLSGWATEHCENAETCCQCVFERWLENGSEDYELSWNGLLELLGDIDFSQLKSELDQALKQLR